MRYIHVMRRVLRNTGANKIWTAFLIQILLTALIIWRIEPGMNTYFEAIWYCYAVVTTIGFGDIVAEMLVSRILSILLSICAAIVIAIITGVIVNFFNQITELKRKETLTALMDKLERLPELSHEELVEISEQVKLHHSK